MTVKPPAPPYVGPAKWHGSATNKPITRITIHCTAGADAGQAQAARNTVQFSKHTANPTSYHYVADSKESLQYVYDSVVAYHAPPNDGSIGYELCCSLSASGAGHWILPSHRAMLKIVARDVARLCLAYDVPIRRLTVAQLRAGQRGIAGHADVRDAWHQTSHWDPGPFFPWRRFLRMIRKEAARLTAPVSVPVSVPVPVPDPPKPAPKTERLHIMQASCQYSDPAADAEADFRAAFSRRPDVIGFTEVDDEARKALLVRVGEDCGYVVHAPGGGGEVAVAVRKSLPILETGAVKVNDGVPGPAAKGGHRPRYIVSARFQWAGNSVWFGEAHWSTGYGRNPGRQEDHVALTRAMISAVTDNAAHRRLAFFGGDINIDEARDSGRDPLKPHNLFGKAGLVTIYDELNETPNTHGHSTLDILGCYAGDGRVSAERVTVWPKGNSDHRQVSAFYNVEIRESK